MEYNKIMEPNTFRGKVLKVAKEKDIETQELEGVLVFRAEKPEQGTDFAKNVLYRLSDARTILFLSGGNTPRALYEGLASEKKLEVGSVAMIDERYGSPMHPVSNEKMIRETGLISYLQSRKIPFCPILNVTLALHPEGVREYNEELGKILKFDNRRWAAISYERKLHELFRKFQKKIAILGMGVDGHTAGIAPDRPDFLNPLFHSFSNAWVGDFEDPKPMSPEGSPNPPHGFGARITLTIKALSQMDLLLVMAFGKDKQEALKKVFEEGEITDVPLRFCKSPKIASKTIFITDQKV